MIYVCNFYNFKLIPVHKNESSLFQKRRNTCILAKHIIVLHVLPKKLHPIPPTKKSFQPFKPSAWIYYDKKQHLKKLIWGLLSSTVKEDNNEYNDKDHCNNSGEGGSDGRVGGVRLPLPLGQLGGLWPRRTYAKIKQWSLTLHSEFCYTCSDIKSLNFKKKTWLISKKNQSIRDIIIKSNNELHTNAKWNVTKVPLSIRHTNELNNIFVLFLGAFFARESAYAVFQPIAVWIKYNIGKVLLAVDFRYHCIHWNVRIHNWNKRMSKTEDFK